MSCSVKGCSNARRFKPENVTFFMFPRGDLLQSWLQVLQIDSTQWNWSKNKVVCSVHFDPEDIIRRGSRSILKDKALPHLRLDGSERATSSGGLADTTSSNMDAPIPSTSKGISQSSSSSGSFVKTRPVGKMAQVKRVKRKSSKTRSIAHKEHEGSTSSGSSPKRRKISFIKSIHSYSISPRKLTKVHIQLKQKQVKCRRKLHSAKQQIKSLKKRIVSLETVVAELRQKNFLSEHATDHLQKSFDSVPHLLLSRYLKNLNNDTVTHEAYPPALREFSSILHFYSSKGYEHVRETFKLALPHQVTIRRWCSNIDCSPGFIEPAFEALKVKVTEADSFNRKVICSMMLDEMAIKKQIEFDGERMWGYIDIGLLCENDDIQPATEALVVMVVAHQSHWKIPIAYFLINSLTGREKANIINECLSRLHDIGIIITSVTCDGPTANFTMMKQLGCDIANAHQMKPSFPHPVDDTQQIYCMLDVCHMLKLMRNMLANLKEIKDPIGNLIKWDYIKKLHELQEAETLHLGNKLKRHHIEWYKQKMKVHLAAQTFSRSVADALQFLNNELNMPEFIGCEATVTFIRVIDKLFDILNSKTIWAGGFKAPLKINNEESWRPFVIDTMQYLLYCTDVGGRPLWNSPKKTPIIGFVLSSMSACGIFDDYVKTGKLNYLLTYKCSQDHLETFFCTVRSRNGWNNNPTALQFMRTFRKLLLHAKITGRGGNCRVLDTTSVLTVPSTSKEKVVTLDIAMCRKYNLDIQETVQEHDYHIIPHFIDISELSSNIITYISGFVVKMLCKSIKCEECLDGCGLASTWNDQQYKLLNLKNRGGLFVPSNGIVHICTKTEIVIRKIVNFTDYKLPTEKGFIQYFVISLGQQFYEKASQLFPELAQHFTDTNAIGDNHGYVLIRETIHSYARIRFFNLAKRYTSTIQGTSVRQQLNKLILFHHQ